MEGSCRSPVMGGWGWAKCWASKWECHGCRPRGGHEQRILSSHTVTQAYGHSYGSQYIVLTCCSSAQTRSVTNVAVSSPYTTAIECCMGSLGQLNPLP